MLASAFTAQPGRLPPGISGARSAGAGGMRSTATRGLFLRSSGRKRRTVPLPGAEPHPAQGATPCQPRTSAPYQRAVADAQPHPRRASRWNGMPRGNCTSHAPTAPAAPNEQEKQIPRL